MDYSLQFLHRCEEFIYRHRLLIPNDRVVVAVSGGLDSVALFYCLQRLVPSYGLQLLIAHFNHGLRGEEADQDENFVAELAAAQATSLESSRGDVRGFAREHHLSLEAAARELRYRFLEQVREKNHFSKIATGHQADDQAETILLHLLRGAGWRGLSGIPVQRGAIIRPLLFAHRQELEKFVQANGLSYRTDHTNESLQFRRNRVRLQLLPLLQKEFNPRIATTLNQLGEVFHEGEEYFTLQAEQAFGQCLRSKTAVKIILEIERFCGYFNIIQKYILFRLVAEVGLPQDVLSFRRLTAILTMIQQRRLGRSLPLTNRWRIGVDHSGIVLFWHQPVETVQIAFPLGESVRILARGIRLISEQVSRQAVVFSADSNIEYIDTERLTDEHCTIRSVRAGDRFVPLGSEHKQKLSDYFIDHKVPIAERRQALVLTSGSEIVWLCGFRLDQRFKITAKTRKVIKLQVIHE